MQQFNNILMKVQRSHELLTTLNAECSEFLMSNPYQLVPHVDLSAKNVIYTIKSREPMPIRLRILAGEVVTHLRSSLDQMVWQLALLTSTTPHAKSEFPIFLDSDKYARDAPRKIGSVPLQAQEIIFDLQPFHTTEPAKHPLSILHRLANDDKHRLITIVCATAVGMGVRTLGDGMSFQTRIGPIDHGGEIGRLVFQDFNGAFDAEVESSICPTIFANLCLNLEGDTSIREVGPTLQMLGTEVENIARRFEKFFLHS